MSHELRTPLAAVHGAAKTLHREDVVVGGEVFRQLLSLISEQSERLARWSRTSCSRAESTSPELEIATEHVDVDVLAAEVIAAARVHAGERLTLELVAPPSLPWSRPTAKNCGRYSRTSSQTPSSTHRPEVA